MPGSTPDPWARRLLGISLYLKIVVAATLLIGGAAGAGVLIARTVPDPWLKLWLALGVLLVAGANALLVGLALRPLRSMETVVRRVEAGELEARVPISRLADSEMVRVVQVVNRMLDAMGSARDRERKLAARVSEAEEMERKRLAHELLDGTAQFLSSALVRIHLAQRGFPEPRPPGLEESCRALEGARSEALEALESIGRIARGLRPPELDELGASRAIEVQARHLARDRRVKIDIEGDAVDAHLAPGAALAMFRILGEGLSNALEHGEPTRIHLRYRLASGCVEIDLEDDGPGFDTSVIVHHPDRNLGLLRMHERARHAGGRLEITSAPARGTRLHLELPRMPAPEVAT